MEAIFGQVLEELEAEKLIPNQVINNLRKYIMSKYPGATSKNNALIFANALNQMLDSKLHFIKEELKADLRSLIIKNTAHRQTFEIDGADILKASILLQNADSNFYESLSNWIKKLTDIDIGNFIIMDFSEKVRSMKKLYPDKSIEELLVDVRGLENNKIEEEQLILHNDIIEDTKYSFEIDAQELNSEEVIVLNYAKNKDQLNYKFKSLIQNLRLIFSIKGISIKNISSLPACRRHANMIAGIVVTISICNAYSVNLVNESALKELKTIQSGNESSFLSNINIEDSKMDNSTAARVQEADGYTEAANEMSEDIKTPKTSLKPIPMKASAYDLSVESCGKSYNHPLYGITFTGKKARIGQTVAVDPNVIPMGKSLYIEFPEDYKYMDGVYVAEDTGRMIKGNRIDIFFGEDKPGGREIYRKALEFGMRDVKVYLMD